VDKKNKIVETNLPDGLLEVYLEDENWHNFCSSCINE
jgi:hypothetical protein